jgi:hypothetical protein
MAKSRKKLTRAVTDALLNEYNHLCAICGAPRPQIHHIDEDPQNNDLYNLIPLCPNHHLTDVHNPTKQMEWLRLRLFREYKDPQILSPQFEPLFQRLKFLLMPFDQEDDRELSGKAVELARFVEYFAMGGYYAARFLELMEWPQPRPYSEEERETVLAENAALYRTRLTENKGRVLQLAIELLRYQTWPLFNAAPWPLLKA